MNQFTAPTTYFLKEGRDNLDECLRVSFQAARQQNIRTIIIFTATGEGVKKALSEYNTRPDYQQIRMVAVSFPAGKIFKGPDDRPMTVEISTEDRELFGSKGIPIVTAHFPFDGLRSAQPEVTPLARDLCTIADALNMFSGSMSLCVESVTMACDAGHVEIGEHVIAMTADTSILARATITRNMLSDLIIREVLCKPAIMTIARNEQVPESVENPAVIIKRPRKSGKRLTSGAKSPK